MVSLSTVLLITEFSGLLVWGREGRMMSENIPAPPAGENRFHDGIDLTTQASIPCVEIRAQGYS